MENFIQSPIVSNPIRENVQINVDESIPIFKWGFKPYKGECSNKKDSISSEKIGGFKPYKGECSNHTFQ